MVRRKYKYGQSKGHLTTIHDLLRHQSGIPDLIHNREYAMRMNDSISTEEIVTYFQDGRDEKQWCLL